MDDGLRFAWVELSLGDKAFARLKEEFPRDMLGVVGWQAPSGKGLLPPETPLEALAACGDLRSRGERNRDRAVRFLRDLAPTLRFEFSPGNSPLASASTRGLVRRVAYGLMVIPGGDHNIAATVFMWRE